ncbi:MAG: hypothetical protein ACFFDF_22540 [Candidatus Odinarchaeota archaeon]
MTRNENATKMLKDLILKNDTQVNIAKKYGYSESYISQIAKQIKQLKYKPIIKNGILLCFKCENESELFDIHHDHSKDFSQPIAIVCHGCNIKLRNNELVYEIERRKQAIFEYINNNQDKEITINTLFHRFKDDFEIYSEVPLGSYLLQMQKEKLIKKVRKERSFVYVSIETNSNYKEFLRKLYEFMSNEEKCELKKIDETDIKLLTKIKEMIW